MAISFFPSSILTPINPNTTNLPNFHSNPINRPNHPVLNGGRTTNFPAGKGPKPKTAVRKLFSTNSDDSPKDDEEEREYDLGVKAALGMLKFYKSEISPILPRSCRFVPTCSEYSMIAYRKYGFAKGSVLTAWRICRCNPLSGDSGFDPPRWFDEKRPTED